MRSFFLAIGIALAFLASSPAFAQPKDLLIFVLAGQSNMSGRGKAPLPSEFRQIEGVWNFNNAWKWERATEPLDSAAGQLDLVSADQSAGVGPGLVFAARMRELRTGSAIGLVQCAKGASSMLDWLQSGSRETLYGSCIARVKEASKRGRVVGMLLYQGESDAASVTEARNWDRHFSKLVFQFRSDLNMPRLPVVFAQIGGLSAERRASPQFAYWDTVKESQSRVKLSHASMIQADKHNLSSDGIHLSTNGYVSIGREFAEAMDSLLSRRR